MRFQLLLDDEALQEARCTFPLFYDDCLQTLPPYDTGVRCAVVADRENTTLAVLQQVQPFVGGMIHITALVVHDPEGLRRLMRFLAEFIHEVQPYASHIKMSARNVVFHSTLPVQQVERIMREIISAPDTGKTGWFPV